MEATLFLAFASLCPLVCSGLDIYKLRVKTCDERDAGTEDPIDIAFCNGPGTCSTGRANVYNIGHDVARNESAIFRVQLDYEPTTMEISKSGEDSWCIDAVSWNGGPNLLGSGGRVYLGGARGEQGCQYGVHDANEEQFPCQASWRFFNLRGPEEGTYNVHVKPCKHTRGSEATAWFCAEPTCERGEVVRQNLTMKYNREWALTRVSLNFNPVSMKLSPWKDTWCAEDIVFKGFSLVTEDNRPVVLDPTQQRFFSNLQYNGLDASLVPRVDAKKDSKWSTVAVALALAVVETVLISGVLWMISFSVNASRRLLRCGRGVWNRGGGRHRSSGQDRCTLRRESSCPMP